MLKVLFFTATLDPTGRTNVGDRVILAGTRNLIAAAFGAYAYREVGRWSRLRVNPDDYDLVVYAGMPQYGARAEVNEVEERFDAMLKSAKVTEFVNIGGGTPARINMDVEAITNRMAEAKNATYYKNQPGLRLRTTRDLAGKRFFDKIGVACDLRPCPSFFSTLHMAPSAKIRDAMSILSEDTFVAAGVKGAMDDHVRTLIDRLPSYELTAHGAGDLALLGRFQLRHTYFRGELDAIDYYATVRNLASLRIHAGVPAWLQGANVVVGGFDGRIHMFDDTGMPIPWVDMINTDFAALADVLEDAGRHVPLERRLALVDAALLSFVARLREACPRAAAAAAVGAEPVEGLQLYPPGGRVDLHPSGLAFLPAKQQRAPNFVSETEPGDRGCVVIPAGSVAAQGRRTKALDFPIERDGAELRSELGRVEAATMAIDLQVKKGVLARAPEVKLPFSRYRATLEFEIEAEGIDTGFQLVLLAKARQGAYGEVVVPVTAGSPSSQWPRSLVLEFENTFAAAGVLIDVILRRTTPAATLHVRRLTIDRL